jgi:diacylglycerol kinase
MKEIIIKAATTIIKVAVIYVVLMATILTGTLGLAIPELGFGILVISGLLLIMVEILNKGGD